MSKNIGIVCEGPTDYILLKGIVDRVTGEDNHYLQLQPETNLMGEYGNGWKGVWKWCNDHGKIIKRYMKDVTPCLDFVIIQLDGDVARKEREVHCLCESTDCKDKGSINPLECDRIKQNTCPVKMPCVSHDLSVEGYIDHLTEVVVSWVFGDKDVCVAIPCDSTDAWIVAAYDQMENVESIEEPWTDIISKGKEYHGIRVPGHKKKLTVYRRFVDEVCEQWEEVKRLCVSASRFEEGIKSCCKWKNCSE